MARTLFVDVEKLIGMLIVNAAAEFASTQPRTIPGARKGLELPACRPLLNNPDVE
jgi:hypothetical protein